MEFVFLDKDNTGTTVSEILDKLSRLPKGTPVYYSDYLRNKDGYVDQESVVPLISKTSQGPIYSHYDEILGFGIVGGKLVNGYSHGRTAAMMARQILNDTPTIVPPVVKKSINTFMFDYLQIKRFGITESDLPEGSIIINKPISFYEEHKDIVLLATGVISVLVIMIVALIINIVRRKSIEAALKKTNAQLLHAEKLSAIGNLSSSIAHEFNNPLQGVMTTLNGVARRATLDEIDAKLITMAVGECNRMRDLIKSLQDFNRPTSGRLAPMDIHITLDGLLMLGKKEYSTKRIIVEKRYTENMPQIKAVADQIKQVFLNLLNNAIDACAGGGTITVETGTQEKRVFVRIHDTGTGIKPEDKDHIFEPFFTTKPEEKGTGLGLSVSYGIIKGHDGDINVESEPGKGTTFSVTLPIEGYNAGPKKPVG